ncbi:hypothetical protein CPB85DRAFT_1258050 [Mucidula mucida]|nr:hypothetical protein CPB85DRAFT_1258050 [Mucidula mucida]
MTVRPLTDSDIRDLSRDDLLLIAQSQKPNWQKSPKHPFNLDRRLGADKLRRLLLDPDEHFTTTSVVSQAQGPPQSVMSAHQEASITQSGPLSGHKSRQGCRPGDWNVECQTVVEALKEEPGAQHILDGPYRLSTPLAEGSDFFEDFLVEKTYRQDLLRVPHHNEILIKVEEAPALDNIRQLDAQLRGAKRKLLSESGAKPEGALTETEVEVLDNDGAASNDGDHTTHSPYPIICARGLKTPPGEAPRKKSRKSNYKAEDKSLTSLLRQQIQKHYTSEYKTFLEHRGCLKLSNSQIIANWQFGVDVCDEYHKKAISGSSQQIDYKHIYGALQCSETWLRDARNYINLVSLHGSPFTAGTAETRTKLESTEVSAGGRKDLIAYLHSLQQRLREVDSGLAAKRQP